MTLSLTFNNFWRKENPVVFVSLCRGESWNGPHPGLLNPVEFLASFKNNLSPKEGGAWTYEGQVVFPRALELYICAIIPCPMSVLPPKDPFLSIARFRDWMYTLDSMLLSCFLMKPLRTDGGENWNQTQRTRIFRWVGLLYLVYNILSIPCQYSGFIKILDLVDLLCAVLHRNR